MTIEPNWDMVPAMADDLARLTSKLVLSLRKNSVQHPGNRLAIHYQPESKDVLASGDMDSKQAADALAASIFDAADGKVEVAVVSPYMPRPLTYGEEPWILIKKSENIGLPSPLFRNPKALAAALVTPLIDVHSEFPQTRLIKEASAAAAELLVQHTSGTSIKVLPSGSPDGPSFDAMRFKEAVWGDHTPAPVSAAVDGLLKVAYTIKHSSTLHAQDIARVTTVLGAPPVESFLAGKTLEVLASVTPVSRVALQKTGAWAAALAQVVNFAYGVKADLA